MYILKIGFNYQTTPVDIREKLTIPENNLTEAMVELNKQECVLENVIISTCNRTEIFAVVDQVSTGRYCIINFLADWFDVKREDFSSYIHMKENDEACEYLMRMTAGLESMVLGETQILGQVRDAFLMAQEVKVTGTIFNELFKQAVTFAKRSHTETAIGEHAVSVSYAAVDLAKKIFGHLENKRVVILGAGEMAELAIQNLQSNGVTNINVVNRTLERAEVLAERYRVDSNDMVHLDCALMDADILITSTGSAAPILSKENIEPIQKQRKGKPLFLIDIAVPRDLAEDISELDSVFLYDIDDLQHIVDENLAERKKAAEKIALMIDGEMYIFKEWIQTLGVVPVISGLREKALSIQTETLKSIYRKMPDLTEREKKVLNKHTKSIINQLLREPIKQAKELAGTDDAEKSLRLFVDIFGIEEEVNADINRRSENDKTMKNLTENKSTSLPLSIAKLLGN